jgi:hypothetical protein
MIRRFIEWARGRFGGGEPAARPTAPEPVYHALATVIPLRSYCGLAPTPLVILTIEKGRVTCLMCRRVQRSADFRKAVRER